MHIHFCEALWRELMAIFTSWPKSAKHSVQAQWNWTHNRPVNLRTHTKFHKILRMGAIQLKKILTPQPYDPLSKKIGMTYVRCPDISSNMSDTSKNMAYLINKNFYTFSYKMFLNSNTVILLNHLTHLFTNLLISLINLHTSLSYTYLLIYLQNIHIIGYLSIL